MSGVEFDRFEGEYSYIPPQGSIALRQERVIQNILDGLEMARCGRLTEGLHQIERCVWDLRDLALAADAKRR